MDSICGELEIKAIISSSSVKSTTGQDEIKVRNSWKRRRKGKRE